MTTIIGLKMQKITFWEEVIPFAGRVVAYETDSYYFAADKGHMIGSAHFGYIEPSPIDLVNGDRGYEMKKLLKPTDIGNTSALTATQLGAAVFSMRLASKEEAEALRQAIANDEAEFEYVFNKTRAYEILTDHLSRL